MLSNFDSLATLILILLKRGYGTDSDNANCSYTTVGTSAIVMDRCYREFNTTNEASFIYECVDNTTFNILYYQDYGCDYSNLIHNFSFTYTSTEFSYGNCGDANSSNCGELLTLYTNDDGMNCNRSTDEFRELAVLVDFCVSNSYGNISYQYGCDNSTGTPDLALRSFNGGTCNDSMMTASSQANVCGCGSSSCGITTYDGDYCDADDSGSTTTMIPDTTTMTTTMMETTMNNNNNDSFGDCSFVVSPQFYGALGIERCEAHLDGGGEFSTYVKCIDNETVEETYYNGLDCSGSIFWNVNWTVTTRYGSNSYAHCGINTDCIAPMREWFVNYTNRSENAIDKFECENYNESHYQDIGIPIGYCIPFSNDIDDTYVNGYKYECGINDDTNELQTVIFGYDNSNCNGDKVAKKVFTEVCGCEDAATGYDCAYFTKQDGFCQGTVIPTTTESTTTSIASLSTTEENGGGRRGDVANCSYVVVPEQRLSFVIERCYNTDDGKDFSPFSFYYTCINETTVHLDAYDGENCDESVGVGKFVDMDLIVADQGFFGEGAYAHCGTHSNCAELFTEYYWDDSNSDSDNDCDDIDSAFYLEFGVAVDLCLLHTFYNVTTISGTILPNITVSYNFGCGFVNGTGDENDELTTVRFYYNNTNCSDSDRLDIYNEAFVGECECTSVNCSIIFADDDNLCDVTTSPPTTTSQTSTIMLATTTTKTMDSGEDDTDGIIGQKEKVIESVCWYLVIVMITVVSCVHF